MRRAALALGAAATMALHGAAVAAATDATDAADLPPSCLERIVAADYAQPTSRYVHGVFGETEEWGALSARMSLRKTCRPGPADVMADVTAVLPEDMVFEDVAPRLADVDGDGAPEIVVVETHVDRGARLAVWGLTPEGLARRAATAFIGRPQRWLAPAAVADLDGDGQVELAYVDRPHLAKTLRIWRWTDRGLAELASLGGVTNHRFGDPAISGGLRTCDGRPEIVLADAAWGRVLAVTLGSSGPDARDLGPLRGPESFARALACQAP